MFDGKTFFPETGMPIRKIACINSPFALAEPVPLTVAILKAKSLMELIGHRELPKSSWFLVPSSRNQELGTWNWFLVKSRPHTESVCHSASYPTPPSDTVRRRARSADRRLHLSPSPASFAEA